MREGSSHFTLARNYHNDHMLEGSHFCLVKKRSGAMNATYIKAFFYPPEKEQDFSGNFNLFIRMRRWGKEGPERGKTGVPLTLICIIKTKNWSPVVQLDGTRTCKIHHTT